MRSPIYSALCSPQKPIPSTCWADHCSDARTKPSPARAITADRPSKNHDKPDLQLEDEIRLNKSDFRPRQAQTRPDTRTTVTTSKWAKQRARPTRSGVFRWRDSRRVWRVDAGHNQDYQASRAL